VPVLGKDWAGGESSLPLHFSSGLILLFGETLWMDAVGGRWRGGRMGRRSGTKGGRRMGGKRRGGWKSGRRRGRRRCGKKALWG
jgi:hypothetical protein